MTLSPLPDDFQLDGVAPTAQPLTPLPDSFQPDGVSPESVTVSANRDAGDSPVGDFAANVGTGVARIPGAIIGTPHVLAHTADWLYAKLRNMADGGNRTGADVDQDNPLAKHTLSSEDVDNGVFKGISAVAGHEVKAYEPTSFIGKLVQVGITGAGAGLLDPVAFGSVIKSGGAALDALEGAGGRMARTAVAADAASTANQIAPDSPGLAAAAAIAAHAGTGAAARGVSLAGGITGDAGRQLLRPAKQGEIEAGRVFASPDVDAAPGLATPSDADLGGARSDVRAATDAIGGGLPDWQSGANLRSSLQGRADTLKAQRAASTDKAFEAFRAQPPLPADELTDFMRSPSFRKAIGAANGAVLDEGGEPLTKYWDFGDGETPGWLKEEAIPPDVLHRVKSQLGDAVHGSPAGSQAARTATMLNNRFGDFLDKQYPASEDFPGYAAIRKGYADASRPLDPMTHGPVEKVLDTDRQFGQSRYTFPDERIPDLFLRSNATRADLNQLVEAHGGDRATALSSLQDHLAGVAQRAVQPDGSLDVAAFDKAMQPYQNSLGNVGMFFPELAKKFGTAKQAQATLGNMSEQRSIADAVGNGALRDADGLVTGRSISNWLRSNKEVLSRTQQPGAVMRLQSIANTLQKAQPGEFADALKSEIVPTAIGTMFGGLEGGVAAILQHKFIRSSLSKVDAQRQGAFSAAMEQAALDPAYAARLAAMAARVGRGVSPVRALARAVAATPLALNAARPTGQ